MHRLIKQFLLWLRKLWVSVADIEFLIQGKEVISMEITQLQKQTVGVQPVNAFGQPAPIQGSPEYSVDKPEVCSLVAIDGTGVQVSGESAGSAVVSVTITSLSGAKVTRTFDVTITADVRDNEATDILFDFSGPVEDK